MAKTMELPGKVAFITGAAGGIGLGIAKACAAAGMKLALADIDAAALNHSVEALAATGVACVALPMDVTDQSAWSAARQTVEDRLGPVQLLCNNAGVSMNGLPFEEVTPELWRKVNAVNYDAPYYGMRAFVPGMRAARSGHIVNTSSLAAVIGFLPNLTAYVASKAALLGLSEAARLEFAPDEIGVTALIPGPVRTRLWRTSRVIRDLPDTDVPPADSSGQSARAAGDPDIVGEQVLEAVRRNEAYVFTDPDGLSTIKQHYDQILAACRRSAQRPANVLT